MDEKSWNAKLGRVARQTFVTLPMPATGVPATARHAVGLVAWLRSQGQVSTATLGDLARAAGVPRKFISRAVALLVRYNLVEFQMGPPVQISLRPESFGRSKNKTPARRAPISKRDRARLYQLDGLRCGSCGKKFPPAELAIDHIVPLSFLGADEPGNWVSLCRTHNSKKSDGFESSYLKFFRGKPVTGTVGVRFSKGAFWPHINGRTQRETRVAWANFRRAAENATGQ